MSVRGDAFWLLDMIQECSATNDEKRSIAMVLVGFVDEWTDRNPTVVGELFRHVYEWPTDPAPVPNTYDNGAGGAVPLDDF
jgi:hypothetical protein